jgi:hypothetical protein
MLRVPFAVVAAATLGMLSGCGGGGSNRNDPPVANALSLATTEDTATQGTFSGSDPDGDSFSAAVATPPTKGSVSVSAANPLQFSYTPNADQNGADSFTYTLNDGRRSSAPATVTIAITAVNDAPRIVQSFSTDEDVAATAQVVTESDGESFSVGLISGVANGALAADPAATGRFTYTPNANFNGTDSFRVRATDSQSTVAEQTVQIVVRAVNDAPVAGPDAARTVQGQSVRFDVLGNDSDVEGDALTVSIPNSPAIGSATVNADGSITFVPNQSFVGMTTLGYLLTDAGGATSSGSVSISVSLTSGLLFLATSDAQPKARLIFADGVRTFDVNAPLAAAETLQTIRPAATAPVVFHTTTLNTVNRLFRVDLRNPGVAQPFGNPTQFPGVLEWAISADGSKVAYVLDGRLQFVDLTAQVQRDLGVFGAGERNLRMNPSGTRVYYSGLVTPPFLHSGALFSLDTDGSSGPRQITPTVDVNSTTGAVEYLSRDERRLFYSVSSGLNSQFLAVDPQVFNSQFVVLDSATVQLGLQEITQDETTFLGRRLTGLSEDYYTLRVGNPGTPTNLTADTSGGIMARALSGDGTRFYYTRSAPNASNSTLYQVDTSAPSVSIPIAPPLVPTFWGVQDLSLAPGGENLVYTTLDRSPLPGGGLGPGPSDVYFVDLSAPSAAVLLQNFTGAAFVDLHASDGSFCVFSGSQFGEFKRKSYVVNLRDRSQIIDLSDDFLEQPMLVTNP